MYGAILVIVGLWVCNRWIFGGKSLDYGIIVGLSPDHTDITFFDSGRHIVQYVEYQKNDFRFSEIYGNTLLVFQEKRLRSQ